MADPFEALGGISSGPPLSELGAPPQQQSAPQPGWPGMHTPSAGTATMSQQHHQPQYPSSVGNSSHFAGNSSVGFHQQNIMGRANSTAPPQPPLPGGSPGDTNTMYSAGQQHQQHQRVAATAPAASWGIGAASASGMFYPPGIASYAPHAQHSGTAGPAAAAAATATATPEPAVHINASAGGRGGGGPGAGAGGRGAEWAPPADQRVSYHEMWASASIGCPVPGTVSGRAAVQFFSRSGLPKDYLKSVSLIA